MPTVRRLSILAGIISLLVGSARLSAFADPTLGVPVKPTGAAGPPVEIDECKLLYSGNWLAGESSGVQIKFTNDSTLVADIVSFRVTATGGETGIIRDVGKFSPGIEITHHYREGDGHMMFAPIFTHPHLDCSVLSVHFSDGSVWQTAVPSAAESASTRAQAGPLKASPESLFFEGVGQRYDQFLIINDEVDIGAIELWSHCAGIAAAKTVATGTRSAVLRVSSVGKGNCSITVADRWRHSTMIPVAVAAGSGGT
jgi:hypothetical protein